MQPSRSLRLFLVPGLLFTCPLAGESPRRPSSVAERSSTWTRAREPWLVIDPQRNVVDVFVAGLLLERLPIERAAIQIWHLTSDLSPPADGAGSLGEERASIEDRFRVESPPSDVARPTVLISLPSADPGSSPTGPEVETRGPTQVAPVPSPSQYIPSYYEAQLDRGYRLVVTSRRTTPGFWSSTAMALRDRLRRIRGVVVSPRPPRLILEVDPAVAAQIHTLLRPGTRIAFGRSEAVPFAG